MHQKKSGGWALLLLTTPLRLIWKLWIGFGRLVAQGPWWLGVGLAVLSYLSLQLALQIAWNPPHPRAAPWTQPVARIAQGLIPLLCLYGASLSAWRGLRQWHRQRLLRSVTRSAAADALEAITWQEFEQLVGEAFRLQGYEVTETGGGGADGGVDLLLVRDGETFLVQCKQWKAFKVGVQVVRELYGVMAAQGATGGWVVTSGRFTPAAHDFAQGRNIALIDGPQLMAMLKKYAPSKAQAHHTVTTSPPAAPHQPHQLHCPLCGAPMVQRRAQRGDHAGQSFWGCTQFPQCKGHRPW
ncbi:restriction endonuclease [Leptothrix ochracea]|uniref:restriction endonuclease n=1 Tax=Leptothrix ochracea TaxID=735331 RepID=UPI0034E223D7